MNKMNDLIFDIQTFLKRADLVESMLRDLIFKSVSATANEHALFLFSVEKYGQEEASSSKLPYVVRSSGRVAHSRCYITDLIDQYQFSLEHCEEAIIRNDYDQPIIGDFYRLRKL